MLQTNYMNLNAKYRAASHIYVMRNYALNQKELGLIERLLVMRSNKLNVQAVFVMALFKWRVFKRRDQLINS
jgi:hypothetical protein